MTRFPSAFVISVLLHVGLFILVFMGWVNSPKPILVTSVPVELVSKVPSREQAESPVDKLAVKTPQPIPAPEEKPAPVPPTPAPKLPVPTPQKAVVPEKKPEPKPVPAPKPPEPKPTPKPADKAPPDKNGMKKPVPPTPEKPEKKTPPAKPALDLDALAQTAAAPSKAPARTLAQANTHKTNGASNNGSGPADAGTVDQALTALTAKLVRLWSPNCDVPGGNKVDLHLLFVISPNGRVISGPDWANSNSDPVWEAAANRAKAAVKRGELYDDLPGGVYNHPLDIEFDARTACRGH